jgi:hypothetical protein
VLYTALFGDYDDLAEHVYPRESSFCFTDCGALKSKSWTVIVCQFRDKSADKRIRAARYFKTHPHSVLPAHNTSIWTDASMHFVSSIEKMVSFLGPYDMATFQYPDIYGTRTCAYDEAKACMQRGKDAADIIAEQMARYKSEGYPTNWGLRNDNTCAKKHPINRAVQ